MNAAHSLRLFYALWPDDDVRAALMHLQTRIAGRKTRAENLHLTLAFLGRQDAALVPGLKDILAALPAGELPVTLDRIGYFTRKHVVWAGMENPSLALLELQHALTVKLHAAGIVFDDHAYFRPHVTLARDAEPPVEFPFEPIAWRSHRIALVESVAHTEGVVYRLLA